MAISLQSIRKERRLKPPLIVLHAEGGWGKNTFAAGAPDPVFLCTEDGAAGQALATFYPNPDRPDDPVFYSFTDLMSAVGALYTEEHEHQTVIIDTLDGVERLVHRQLCEEYRQPKIDTNETGSPFAYGRGYLYAVDLAVTLLDGLRALRDDKGMAVGFLVHTTAVKVEPPDQPAYTEWSPDVHKRLAAEVYDWSDMCLFGRFRGHAVKDEDARDKKKTRTRGVGTGERVLYTERRPAWLAKNRYGLPPEIPNVPREGGWQILQDLIAASMNATPVTTTTNENE